MLWYKYKMQSWCQPPCQTNKSQPSQQINNVSAHHIITSLFFFPDHYLPVSAPPKPYLRAPSSPITIPAPAQPPWVLFSVSQLGWDSRCTPPVWSPGPQMRMHQCLAAWGENTFLIIFRIHRPVPGYRKVSRTPYINRMLLDIGLLWVNLPNYYTLALIPFSAPITLYAPTSVSVFTSASTSPDASPSLHPSASPSSSPLPSPSTTCRQKSTTRKFFGWQNRRI
ncbi:hypothetical protein B0H16DRAFT_1463850 [Mycena metata]|uniref:Uncharacterized protein n=1 Tax=Mycena metata TaxID=1033252 RepID=A0AAD7IIR4_9AGAR|nr:hypothetical protein B0H16DRAFT_1463850 [Mycena metata]